MNVENEFRMLRAYATQSKSGTQAVDFKDVAHIIELDESAVSSSKKFWEEVGALVRIAQGEHKPVDQIVRWALKVDFNPEEANAALHELFDLAWFGAKVREAFAVNKDLDRERLAAILGNVAGGEREATAPRTRVLVEILAQSGYILESEDAKLSLGALKVPPPTTVPPGPIAQRVLPETLPPQENSLAVSGQAVRNHQATVSVNLSISDWSVEDVIRLFEYLRTGKDATGTNGS